MGVSSFVLIPLHTSPAGSRAAGRNRRSLFCSADMPKVEMPFAWCNAMVRGTSEPPVT